MSCCCLWYCFFFFFKQKTAYEMRISDWSSDVCSSDLIQRIAQKTRCRVQVLVVVAERPRAGAEAEQNLSGVEGDRHFHGGIDLAALNATIAELDRREPVQHPARPREEVALRMVGRCRNEIGRAHV